VTDQVRFTTRWNAMTSQPIEGHEWISEDQARQLVAGNEFVDVVDFTVTDDDGVDRPRWVIGITSLRGVAGGARVEFYDVHGTCWRVVDYDLLEGRLWRSSVTDRHYQAGIPAPDDFTSSLDTQRWKTDEAIRTERATVNPDGTGVLKIRDRTTGEKSLTNLSGLDVAAHWLDVPVFGDWDALTDPGRSATEIAQGVSSRAP
jgi:hypothetical protein